MKLFVKNILIGAVILVLLYAAPQLYWFFVNREVAEQGKRIREVSDSLYMFGHDYLPDQSVSIANFDIPTERDAQLNTWIMKLSGDVSVSFIDSEGETVFRGTVGYFYETNPVHLKEGSYRVVVQFSNALGIGGAVGVALYTPVHAPILPDTDRDGLPDELEAHAGTDPGRADTDGDSLSDYEEAVKYKTNPQKADSDGDGVPDGDWNERREFAYSVRAVIRMREPFDPETMNDSYQDVRMLEPADEQGYTMLEAVMYPEPQPVLAASAFPVETLPEKLRPFTQPGIGTNYDADMQAQVLQIIAGATTDVEVVERVLNWVRKETHAYLDYSIPEVYFTYLDGGEVKVRNYKDPFPVEDLLRTHYFAASMFRERTHGTCTSIATLKCAMLRAAGIPCRLIQSVFPVYYHGDQTEPYTNNLKRRWDNSICYLEQARGDEITLANHGYEEVYLGGRWVRVDEDLGIYFQLSRCLSLKILAVADWSEVDFSETWPTGWITDRPYYTVSIEDQEPAE